MTNFRGYPTRWVWGVNTVATHLYTRTLYRFASLKLCTPCTLGPPSAGNFSFTMKRNTLIFLLLNLPAFQHLHHIVCGRSRNTFWKKRFFSCQVLTGAVPISLQFLKDFAPPTSLFFFLLNSSFWPQICSCLLSLEDPLLRIWHTLIVTLLPFVSAPFIIMVLKSVAYVFCLRILTHLLINQLKSAF